MVRYREREYERDLVRCRRELLQREMEGTFGSVPATRPAISDRTWSAGGPWQATAPSAPVTVQPGELVLGPRPPGCAVAGRPALMQNEPGT